MTKPRWCGVWGRDSPNNCDRSFTARGFSIRKTLSPNLQFGAMRQKPHWAVGRATRSSQAPPFQDDCIGRG
ncbi:hypothetical protein I8748_14945 [Nostoc sp. CENA67]|uniref:Uncharacterized protein n=1 Tax=Amazonocrinis nigriterrae CENA67 TaxID=2794033 RepID=A0A8J7LBA4_9NOST|nr:hypothetical protein [Amazonocrinis nigriterrae CENA67]